jgi:hypothetical protein
LATHSLRYNAQSRRPPAAIELADMALGKASLPWDSAGLFPRDEIECVANEFRKRHHEWCRAGEEKSIAVREVIDSTAYYGDREAVIFGALEVLADSSFTPFSAAEGHAFYLLQSAAAIIDVHRRMLGIASLLGVELDLCISVHAELAAVESRAPTPGTGRNAGASVDSNGDSDGVDSEPEHGDYTDRTDGQGSDSE